MATVGTGQAITMATATTDQAITMATDDSSSSEPPRGTEETDNTFYTILVVVGLIGAVSNLFVIIVICGFTKMRSKITGLFVLSQTCLDFLNSFLLSVDFMVFIWHGFVVPSSFGETGGELFCRFYLTEWLQWGLLYSSTYNLIAINLERYLSVVHPVVHRSLTPTTFAYPTLVAVWLFGPTLAISWAQVSTYMSGGDCMLYDFHGDEAVSSAYAFCLISFIYFVPLSTVGFFYGRMIWVLQKSSAKQGKLPSAGAGAGAEGSRLSRAQKNLFKTMLMVTLAYVICWTLDQVCWLLFQTGVMPVYDLNLYYTAYVLVSLNACVNPIIYITSYREFKRGMKKLLRRGRILPSTNDSTTLGVGGGTVNSGV